MIWPSVTQILGVYVDWSAIPDDVLRNASKRGTRVHRKCAAMAMGLPVLGRTDFEVEGYLASFQRWLFDWVSSVVIVEKRLFCSTFKFTGQIDLLVEMVDGSRVLVDLKTPAVKSKTWQGQLAAYGHLCMVNKIRVDCGMALMLRKDGKPPKAIPYMDQGSDWAAFLSALNAYRYFS